MPITESARPVRCRNRDGGMSSAVRAGTSAAGGAITGGSGIGGWAEGRAGSDCIGASARAVSTGGWDAVEGVGGSASLACCRAWDDYSAGNEGWGRWAAGAGPSTFDREGALGVALTNWVDGAAASVTSDRKSVV